MYDDKTFTPDGSAQLWAVGLWTGPAGDEETFAIAAPVVGWFDHTPAVQDTNEPKHFGAEPVDEWAKDAKLCELVHVSDLARKLAQYEEHVKTYLDGLVRRERKQQYLAEVTTLPDLYAGVEDRGSKRADRSRFRAA